MLVRLKRARDVENNDEDDRDGVVGSAAPTTFS